MSDMQTRIKELLIDNEHLSALQLQEILMGEGLKLTIVAIYSIRRSFLSDLKLIKELGLFQFKPDRIRRPQRKDRPKRYGPYSDLPKKPFKPWRFSG